MNTNRKILNHIIAECLAVISITNKIRKTSRVIPLHTNTLIEPLKRVKRELILELNEAKERRLPGHFK